MRIILLIFILSQCLYLLGQQMRIGVLTDYQIKQLDIQSAQGSYDIFGDKSIVSLLVPGRKVSLSVSGSRVVVHVGGLVSYTVSKVMLVPQRTNSSLLFSSRQLNIKKHSYEDALEIFVYKGRLQFVNVVDMNNYISGVVESEGGGGRHLEYYKVQALMSRTYALKNKRRHEKEGFELCDRVHCQAYHSKLRYTPKIRQAVESTSGEVIIDFNGDLVTSYFAANCGGQTCDASYVWNNSVPYLSTFKDTFCLQTRQSRWTKRIPKATWSSFLAKKYGVKESTYGALIYNFDQENRKAFYIHPSLGVPLRDLRKEFKLKSSYFSTKLDGQEVVLSGRGFGHGVGLCQEGAMGMADLGLDYKQIALYYFNKIRIINYYESQFFKQKKDVGTGNL
ncbi:MAG: SpoIID/LytB domain-containing protein [Crocinitomicaceae bacterium]|nr:SpoIID/LytB domain-containing protein [Crocinitomicaceae bacterium]MDG1777505.1 SpoIID/LytB domain-containing protein [Crocinitomicaceae bacterium]